MSPKPGHICSIYFNDSPVGSGERVWLVTQVGHKFIHLFYSPDPTAFKIPLEDWPKLRIKPIGKFSQKAYKQRLRAKIAAYDLFGYQYPGALCEDVLKLTITGDKSA